jgi:dTDP-4-dehydrorhamnose reductase
MRILLTGPTGQIGSALLDTLPSLGEVVPLDRSELDLSRPDTVRAAVRATRPDVIVNAAAYTAVDQAEREESLAFRVNRDGPAVLAEEAAKLGALLVHFSTDYVFDGHKTTPYVEDDIPNPLNVYGKSKLAGERAIVSGGCRYLILRTSWIYGPQGRNFMLTILRAAKERSELRVVDDQVGTPTSSLAIARATVELLHGRPAGVYHLSAAGKTTWCGFAREILARAGTATRVLPIRSEEYPAAARRPHNSLLDNSRLQTAFGVRLRPWEEQLDEVMAARSP